jgi:hypothetical protein
LDNCEYRINVIHHSHSLSQRKQTPPRLRIFASASPFLRALVTASPAPFRSFRIISSDCRCHRSTKNTAREQQRAKGKGAKTGREGFWGQSAIHRSVRVNERKRGGAQTSRLAGCAHDRETRKEGEDAHQRTDLVPLFCLVVETDVKCDQRFPFDRRRGNRLKFPTISVIVVVCLFVVINLSSSTHQFGVFSPSPSSPFTINLATILFG